MERPDPEAPSPESLPIPVVPGFSGLVLIGRGPRGSVYRASNGKYTVALKVFRPGVRVDRTVLERFLKGSPARLRHPNLPVLESCGETEGGVTVHSMQFLAGDALAELLDDLRRGECRRPSLSPLAVGPDGKVDLDLPRRGAEVIAEVAEGLALAHAAGIAHGRLTPRNLIFSPTGRLVITDFGGEPGAREAGKSGSSPDALAALLHRAPETLSAPAARRSPAADVYALGVMLHEIAARQPPFAGRTARELKDAIREGRSALPAGKGGNGVPPALEACIARAMAIDPARRHRDAGELAEELRLFLPGATPSPQPRAAPQAPVAVDAAPAAAHVGGASREVAPRRFPLRWRWRPAAAAALFLGLVLAAASWGSRLLNGPTGAGGVTRLDPGGRAPAMGERGGPGAAAEPLLAASIAPPEHLVPLDWLDSPRPAARAAGLERLAAEVAGGRRPRDDARAAARLLRAPEATIRGRAFATLALAGDAAALLEALDIGAERPPVAIDAGTFLDLLDAVTTLAAAPLDEATRRVVCSWDLAAAQALDAAPRPARVELPPNLAVDLGPGAPRSFTERWIRLAARLDPEAILEAAPRLGGARDIQPALVAALAAAGGAEAAAAVTSLARSDCLGAGPAALQALADLGAADSLLELAVSELPLSFREEALRVLGEAYPGAYFPGLEIVTLLGPETRLRRAAFRILSACEAPAAAKVMLRAADDPALRAEVFAWLRRIEAAAAAPLAVKLLGHREPDVRREAAALLARGGWESHVLPLGLHFLSPRPEVRSAALQALGPAWWRSLGTRAEKRLAAAWGGLRSRARRPLQALSAAGIQAALEACKMALAR